MAAFSLFYVFLVLSELEPCALTKTTVWTLKNRKRSNRAEITIISKKIQF